MRLIYDDYHWVIRDGCIIGTVTREFGNPALRHGWKIIEVYNA